MSLVQTEAPTAVDRTARASSLAFLAMVAVLPLHTVAFHFWVSWKPWLILLGVLGVLHLRQGLSERSWPWHPALSIASGVFLASAAASWSGTAPERYARLLLALAVGSLVLLTTARELRRPEMLPRVLRTVFWSAAAMATTGFLLSLIAAGTFGQGPIDWVDRLPLVDRVFKPAYLDEGFLAVTNWHQDPGYAAAWTNLWAALAMLASRRGLGSRRWTVDALVVGGLWLGVFMTFSRTGALGSAVAIGAVLWHERHAIRPAIRLVAASLVAAVVLIGVVWALDRPAVGGDVGEALSYRIEQGVSLGPGGGDPGPPGTGTIDYRGVVWPAYVDAFQENPLRGIGLGTGWEDRLQEPHNILLELLGEMGLIGLAGFAVLAVTIVRHGTHPVGRIGLVVALSAAITQTVLFEVTWWFAAGLAMAPRPPPPVVHERAAA